MENSESGANEPPADPNPSRSATAAVDGDSAAPDGPAAADVAGIVSGGGARRPFTELSQVDADLALARVLQEQERAYMMLRMGGDYDLSDAESYNSEDFVEEEGEEAANGADAGAVDGHVAAEEEEGEGSIDESEYEEEDEIEVDLDPAEFEDDESYARALQEAEEREVAARLMALSGLRRPVDQEEIGGDSQDAWQEVDPDNYSYEELVALGEVVGTESKGLPADVIASLPSITFKSPELQDENIEQCVVCRVEYEEGDSLTVLPCKHKYHSECINQWLQINKVCPMCSIEVSTSKSKQQE